MQLDPRVDNRAAVQSEARELYGVRTMQWAIAVGFFLATVKIVAGILGNTYALVADGIESILDIISGLLVVGGLQVAARPPDREHQYGHGKAEELAALVVAGTLLCGAGLIAVQSVAELRNPHESPAPFTLLVLPLVVAVKELLYRRLRHSSALIGSNALQADAWHQRSDALTSAAAFVGILIAIVGGEAYAAADDWAALLACVVIFFNGARILRGAVRDIMDAAAPERVQRSIRTIALSTAGVLAIEKCLTRKSGLGWFVDLHVIVDGSIPVAEGHEIGHQVRTALRASDLAIHDVLVHIEPDDAHPELLH